MSDAKSLPASKQGRRMGRGPGRSKFHLRQDSQDSNKYVVLFPFPGGIIFSFLSHFKLDD